MRQAIILAMCLVTPCAAQDVKALLAQSEPPIQEQFNKILDAIKEAGVDPRSNIAAIQQAHSLNESIADKGEIVKQLAILAAVPGEVQPLMARAILDLLDLPPAIVIRVLAPYLDADNKNLRSFVRDWFQSHDNGGTDDPLKPVNFEDYADYVRGQQNPPEAFVEYIYGRSPGRALLVFHRAGRTGLAIAKLRDTREKMEAAKREADEAPRGAWPRKAPEPQRTLDDIMVAERIVSHAITLKKWENGKLLPEAKEQLAKLAEREEWWVRRYVAEIMRQHPELRQDEVLEKLSEDDNATVSNAAKG
jgi:hypothetical protein